MKTRVRKKKMTVKKDQQPLGGRLLNRKKIAEIGPDHRARIESLHGKPVNDGEKGGCLLICNDLALLKQACSSFNETNAPAVYADHAYGNAGRSGKRVLPVQLQVVTCFCNPYPSPAFHHTKPVCTDLGYKLKRSKGVFPSGIHFMLPGRNPPYPCIAAATHPFWS